MGKYNDLKALTDKSTYLNKNYQYIKNVPITEYDMHNAGINILSYLGYLTEEHRKYLSMFDNLQRNIIVGNMMRENPQWNEAMFNEYKKIRYSFAKHNNIFPEDILAIKKDAIFIINHPNARNLELNEYFKFTKKHEYNAYIYSYGKEFYVNTSNGDYNVKNFNHSVAKVQEDYLFEALLTAIVLDIEDNSKEVFNHFKNFRNEYLKRELEIPFYMDMEIGGYTYELNEITYNSRYYPLDDKYHLKLDSGYKYIEDFIHLLLTSNE